MRKLSLLVLSLVLFNSCLKDQTNSEYMPFDVNGSVNKGSYLSGSNITFYELADELGQTGGSYFTSITDGAGNYTLNIDDVDEDFTLAIANGYYWDEVRNIISDGELDLKGVFKWSESININVLSHLEAERVMYLIQNDEVSGNSDRKRFNNAKKQALNEVLAAFGIDEEFEKSEDFNFIDGDNKSKILVAISSVIQADRDTYEVEALLAELSEDIRKDGSLDSEVLKEQIGSRLCILNIDNLSQNVFDKVLRYNPTLTERSYISNYLDAIKEHFPGYTCSPVMRFGRNTISIGLKTESIDERCNELTFFKDLNNDGIKDANEIVLNKLVVCSGENGSNSPLIGLDVKESTDCENGGRVYTFFYDTNENGVLDSDEQEISVETVCNGENGSDGTDGNDGSDGSDGNDGSDGQDAVQLGVFVSNVDEGECENGGFVFNVFEDLDFDGEYDEGSETIVRSSTLCFPEPEVKCEIIKINDERLEQWLVSNGYDDFLNGEVDKCNLLKVEEMINPTISFSTNFEIFPNLKTFEIDLITVPFERIPDPVTLYLKNNNQLENIKIYGIDRVYSGDRINYPKVQVDWYQLKSIHWEGAHKWGIGRYNHLNDNENEFELVKFKNLESLYWRNIRFATKMYFIAPNAEENNDLNLNLKNLNVEVINNGSFFTPGSDKFDIMDFTIFPNLEKLAAREFSDGSLQAIKVCGLDKLTEFNSTTAYEYEIFVKEEDYNLLQSGWNIPSTFDINFNSCN